MEIRKEENGKERNNLRHHILTWGQLGVILTLITCLLMITFKTSAIFKEKADKTELCRVERQSISRDDQIRMDIKNSFSRIEGMQDKILDKLLEKDK